MAEMGIGERALKQFADTATGLLTDVVSPLGDYLEKYENIFDQRVYNSEIQSLANKCSLHLRLCCKEASENTTGQTSYMICRNSSSFKHNNKKSPHLIRDKAIFLRLVNYKAAFAASTTTAKASLSLTARSASIFLLT